MPAPPRFLLALESATDRISVAVLEDDRVRALRAQVGSRAHSTALLRVVDETLVEAGLGLGAIEAMAITTGPGSFTSLRIGLATLKGLAFGRDLPVVGISTLEAMAWPVLEEAGGPVLALLDARRGEWYAGAWAAGKGSDALPVEVLPPGLYAPARLAGDCIGPVVAVCPEPGAWPEIFASAGLRILRRVAGEAASPRADRVGALGRLRLARGESGSAAELTARYLRRAQAEALRTGEAVEPGTAARTTAAGTTAAGTTAAHTTEASETAASTTAEQTRPERPA